MLRVCGIVLKSKEMISVVLEGTIEDYQIVSTSFDKYKLIEPKDQEAVKKFKTDIHEFFDYEDFHAIGIKERIAKGRFAGGAITFKMEGLIQTSDYPVQIIHGNRIKAKTKDKIIPIAQVKKYQEDALLTAFYLLQMAEIDS